MLNKLLYFLVIVSLLQLSFCAFEIFASGVKSKLGIGQKNPEGQYSLTKVVIDQQLKSYNLTSFLISKQHSAIKINTPDSYYMLFFGNNDNGRISDSFPKIMYETPIAKQFFYATSGPREKYALLLEDFTFLADQQNIESFGFPSSPSDLFYANLQMYHKKVNNVAWSGNFSTNVIYMAGKNQNAFILPSADWNWVEFGSMMGLDGSFLIKDYNTFRKKTPRITEIHKYPLVLKLQGMKNIFQAINENYEFYVWGFDPSSKVSGLTVRVPYLEIFDVSDYFNPVRTNRSPQTIHKPTGVVFNVNGTATYRFRNVFAGFYSTIALTQDNRWIGWGKNQYNMLSIEGYDPKEEYVFPPRYLSPDFPSPSQVKQISIGEKHTLVLKTDNTVWGIGTNENGELAQPVSVTESTKLVQLKIPSYDACFATGDCSIDFISASTDTTFIAVNSGQLSSIQIQPTCYGISYLDIHACSGNGFCTDRDVCNCFKGYDGKQCEKTNDCSAKNRCNGNGFCVSPQNKCDCFFFAAGDDCSLPKCGEYSSIDANVCSGNGKCRFVMGMNTSECYCNEGWNGLFCANGPKSPILYSAGASSFGETGTGIVDKYVTNFTRVSFFMSEWNENYKLKQINAGYFSLAFMYGERIHTISAAKENYLALPVLGWSFEGVFSVPFPADWSEYIPHKIKDFGINLYQGVIFENGDVYLMRDLTDEVSTQPLLLLEAKNSSNIYATSGVLFFLKDGEIYAHGDNTYGEVGVSTETTKQNKIYHFTHVPILDGTTPVKIAKCCTNSVGIMCLSINGNVFRWGPNFWITDISYFPTKIAEHLGTIYDIKCGAYASALKTKDNSWYTWGYSFDKSAPLYHYGHENYDKIEKAVFFEKEGHDLIDFSMGKNHSLILMKERTTGKKKVFVMGQNTERTFGYEPAPAFVDRMTEIPFPPDIPVQSFTRVLATDYNSFVGDWEDLQPPSSCHGIPNYLTDLVCNKRGKCVNGVCNCEGKYVNIDTLDPNLVKSYRREVEGALMWTSVLKRLTGINVPKIMWWDLKIIPDNTCIEKEDISIFFTIQTQIYIYAVLFLMILSLCPLLTLCVCLLIPCAALVACLCGILGTCSFVKRNRKKETKQLLQKLLDTNDELGEYKEKKIDMTIFNLDFNDFKITNELAAGGSGAMCFEAIDKKNDEKVFIKLFAMRRIEGTGEWDTSGFSNEIQHLTRLRHTNIVNFYGMFFAAPSRVGYVCEFCTKGSVHHFLHKLKAPESKRAVFDTRKKLDWLIQIAKGMRFLHQKDIIFRDLKPENVLIGKNEVLKITDFGISKIQKEGTDSNNLQMMTKNAGTSFYMAPEVVAGNHYDNKIDTFSFGILMYEILFETVEPYGSNPPFGVEFRVSQDPDYRPIINMEFFKKPQEIEIVSSMVQLMKECWDHDPKNRPNFREIVAALQQNEEEFEKLEEK